MKKVSELTGAYLDYWVAKSQGYHCAELKLKGVYEDSTVYSDRVSISGCGLYRPSSDWSHGGPIIERKKIRLWCDGDTWIAIIYGASDSNESIIGSTPLIAAMRCYVASIYGEHVNV